EGNNCSVDSFELTAMSSTQDWDALLCQEPPRVVPSSLRAVALRGERHWQVSLVFLAVVCALVAAVFFPWSIADDVRLDLGGTSGRGVVLDSVYANQTIGDDAVLRKRLVFRVNFRFEDARAREYEATSLFFGYLKPGTEVEVEYLPSNPALARVRDGFFVPGGLWEVWLSVMFLAVPLFGVWNLRCWRGRRLALLIHGVQVPGCIERGWREQPQDHSRGWIEMTYTAQDRPIRVSEMVEREAYERSCVIVEGQLPVRVLHVPHAPHQHIVLELMH
ncbi:MAG: hypothetical protein QF797_04625, partial [Alphaproteobacteria bacterium]|nr:hypothetical protein [Alphaproteobacteria bacterium]